MNNPKILIVDDLIESLKVIIQHLQISNPEFTLYQSNSAIKALEIAQKIKPDLIITDWDMPELNGIELIKKLKNIESTKNIPIIVASGIMITSENLKVALEAGAVDFLRKPIDPIELQARINSSLTISKYHKESIQAKNHELMEISLSLVKNNEYSIDLKKKLDSLMNYIELCTEAKNVLTDILEDLDNKINSRTWEHFNIAFFNVHPKFNKNLVARFPDLSPAEIKLSTLIHMGMSIKDISSLLNQSPDGIKVARSRLRKKLNLETEQNLESFLASF